MSLVPAPLQQAATLVDEVVIADGESAAASGYADAQSVVVDVSVSNFISLEPDNGVSTPVVDTDSVTIYLEDSVDGNNWTEQDSDTLSSDGTLTLSASAPADKLRVRWDVEGTNVQVRVHAVATALAGFRVPGASRTLQTSDYAGAGDGAPASVTDGSVTVPAAATIRFDGATVSDEGAGLVKVTLPPPNPAPALVAYRFTIAYDDADLNDGVELFTPAAGDVLVSASAFVQSAFNGTTPKFDFGLADVTAATGLFAWLSSAPSLATASDAAEAAVYGVPDSTTVLPSAGVILTGDPLTAWVSQDGLLGGDAVGGTDGILYLFILIATTP